MALKWFDRLARKVSNGVGHPASFLVGLALVLGWATAGPVFGWSDRHSLFINTATTIATFLIVFLIQASQNRDSAAIQAKLDEIVRALPEADDGVRGMEKEQ
jgi:low affinity Fe/Cu permease